MKSLTIPSAHHSSSYPEDPRQLLKHFERLLSAAKEPNIPPEQKDPSLLIVPHIDFRVNLGIYASIYRLLLKRKRFPKTFVVLGVGHRCPAEFSFCLTNWETPLGLALASHEHWSRVQESVAFEIARFPDTFHREHSLEYVVVWLQAIRDLYFPGQTFTFLPILMGGLHQEIAQHRPPCEGSPFSLFGKALRHSLAEESESDVCWIASIDGCHVGYRFHHPFTGNHATQEAVKNWESTLWSHCETTRFPQFFEHIASIGNMFYFDGVGVLTLLLQNFNIKAFVHAYDLWYEESDQSFVTFTGGFFQDTHSTNLTA